MLKSRGEVTADIEINGGHLAPCDPSFAVRGSRGIFTVAPNADEGVFHVVEPAFHFPRRRSSVRTPPLDDMHEDLKVVDIPATLPPAAEKSGAVAFWRALYATIRTAEPFPVSIDDVVEATRYLQLVKKASPFSK